jgi:uncharacterized protein (DUF2147 family)
MRLALAAAAALTLATFAAPAGAAPADILGRWQTENGARAIDIYRCRTKLCGRIVRTDGAQTDANNVRRRLRGRSLVGVRTLFDMRAESDTRWVGQTYLPSDGRTYFSQMFLDGGKLSTRACLLGGSMCSGSTWVRPPR